MHTLSTEDLEREPHRLLDDAQRGEINITTRGGQPILLAVPLGPALDSPQVRPEIATTLFAREQIGLGTAARMAGLAYSEMIDGLGRRGVATIRLEPGELERELAAFNP